MNLEGGCFCGAVRYRLTDKPMFVNCCHCRDCQKQSGGAFVINAVIERDRVEVLAGEPVATETPTDSGRPHDIYRCTTCQSALWSDYGRRGNIVFVRVATLGDPSALPPDAHIYTRSALAWEPAQTNAPSYEAFYDLPNTWPPVSLSRAAALQKS